MEGIEMPVLSYRWRLILGDTESDISIIAKNTEKCMVDYSNQKVEIVIRQTVSGTLHDTIYEICQKENFNFRIESLDGNANILHATEFFNAKITNHKVAYNYGGPSEVLNHVLTVSFKKMILMVPEE